MAGVRALVSRNIEGDGAAHENRSREENEQHDKMTIRSIRELRQVDVRCLFRLFLV